MCVRGVEYSCNTLCAFKGQDSLVLFCLFVSLVFSFLSIYIFICRACFMKGKREFIALKRINNYKKTTTAEILSSLARE